MNTISYLQDLEQLGYCVIPQVIPEDETKALYARVWHEFIEKAWPLCKMDDRSNWKEAFPAHNTIGIFAGPAAHTQVMYDLRQDPRIVSIFAAIWGTKDLLVSLDGLNIMCPTEIREGFIQPWPHVDQGSVLPEGFVSESPLKTKPYTIQGQFLFEESCEGDGGFYCIPKSHLKFAEIAPQLEAREKPERYAFINEYFKDFEKKQITAPRGSLILWDSRTVHWNQHATVGRANPKVRMIGYLCYVPKSRLTEDAKARRDHAIKANASTGHNPADPAYIPSKDGQCFPGFEHYLEDAAYNPPPVQLTELGQSLLGI
jgi:hypothetical protein